MSRTKLNPTTSVNFRMPNSILKGIDEMAVKNLHDRSAEINGACRFWIEIGGKAAADETTLQKISALENKIDTLEKEIRIMMSETQKDRETLLKIIDNNEHTIKRLLSTLPSSE
ncbi:MAG: hypothetical protein Q4Q53_00345 [Methanocorpusculum sp.]|nr:hypothetical protein [Methanocorpusculum sp.]